MTRRAAVKDFRQFTLRDNAVARARKKFQRRESRDLFYKAAIDLTDAVRAGSTRLTLEEALAVLLQTWNRAYYQYTRFDEAHFRAIRQLLDRYRSELEHLRGETIEALDEVGKDRIVALFQAFEAVLRPVGAAKALHLLAPGLFPIWDRKIAAHYGRALVKAGSNGERYWQFMLICRHQSLGLSRDTRDRLKAIDEYNYCKFTKGWI